MSTEELKLQIFRQVDSLDGSRLREFYGIMLNYLNSKKDTAEWVDVSDVELLGIEEAINELHQNRGISNEQVMANIKEKYIHA